MVDPYDWLGIPKAQRPPTYYQLLGLSPLVTETVAIREAAARQLNKLQPHLTGPHAVTAERIQREIHEARDTLLDPEQRRLYDILTPTFDDPALPKPAPPTPKPTAPKPTPGAGGPSEWWREVGSEPAPPMPSGKAWWQEAPPVDADAPPPPPPRPISVSSAPAPVAVPATTAPPRDLGTDDFATHRRKQLAASNGQALKIIAGVGVVALILVVVLLKSVFKDKSDRTQFVDDGKKPNLQDPPKIVAKTDEPGSHIDIDQPGPPPSNFFDQLAAKTLKAHSRAAVGVAVSSNGLRMFSIGEDRALRLWSLRKDTSLVRHQFKSAGVAAALSNDDSKVIACDGPTFAVLDANKMTAPRVVESPRGGHLALAASTNGSIALAGMSDGQLRLYNTDTLKFDEWSSGGSRVLAVAMSADGSIGFSATAEGAVTVWNLSTRAKVHEWTPHPASGGAGTIAMHVAPSGKQLATGGTDNTAAIYDLTQRKEIARFKEHAGPVTGVVWLADGRRVVSCSTDGSVRMWNAENGHFLRWSQAVEGKLQCVVKDQSEHFVAVGSSTGAVHVLPLPRVRSEVLTAPLAKQPADALPLPNPTEVAAASKALRTELAADFKHTRPDEMTILASNLYHRATVENVPAPLRYALLVEARTLAMKADDAEGAIRANDFLATWFEVDDLAEATTLLTQFPGRAERPTLLLHALKTVEKAERDARPDIVAQLLQILPQAASVPEELKARVQGARARSEATLAELSRVQQALTTLKSAPTEPNASLALGRYLCFTRQDWNAGLPYLARGADAALRVAANAELGKQTDAKDQFQMGEGWRQLALKTDDPRARRAMLLRSKAWFEKAAKTATELIDQVKARAKIDDVEKANTPITDPTIPVIGLAAVIRHHFNTLAPAALPHEWLLSGETELLPTGVRMKAAQPTLTSRFEIGDGTRVVLTIIPDGREMKFTCNGEEFVVPGTGSQTLVAIERRGHALQFSYSIEQAKPVAKLVPLAPLKQGTSAIVVRLNGMPKLTEGALFSAAVVRGPVQLVPPKPE